MNLQVVENFREIGSVIHGQAPEFPYGDGPMLTKDAISEAIADAISERGWSVAQLASKTNLAKSTTDQMVKGRSLTIENISEALLGLDMSWHELVERCIGPSGKKVDISPNDAILDSQQLTATIVRLSRQHEELDKSRVKEIARLEQQISDFQEHNKEFVTRLFAATGTSPARGVALLHKITNEFKGAKNVLGESPEDLARRIR